MTLTPSTRRRELRPTIAALALSALRLNLHLTEAERKGERDQMKLTARKDPMRLYLNNFPYSTTKQDLRDLLAPYGPVTDAQIITDRATGQRLGYGFAVVRDGHGAIAALDGKPWNGRTLRVQEAKPPRVQRAGAGVEVRA